MHGHGQYMYEQYSFCDFMTSSLIWQATNNDLQPHMGVTKNRIGHKDTSVSADRQIFRKYNIIHMDTYL